MANSPSPRSSWGNAWVAVTASLAVHAVDEALTDFLSFWNPTVLRIRERIPWSPLPTFTFDVWLGGLVIAVAVLGLLSVFAMRGAMWMRPVAYVYGSLMLLNGFAHITISLFQGRPAPGVTSALLLIGTSLWLLISLVRSRSSGRRIARGSRE